AGTAGRLRKWGMYPHFLFARSVRPCPPDPADRGGGMEREALERELGARVEALGYEVVELETAGSNTRPLLRLRIDRPGSEPGNGVTVDDCTRVSRALQQYLDEQQD